MSWTRQLTVIKSLRTRERYAEITAMDRAIGQLREHLAAQGLRDNTLLFYGSDNGTSADSTLGVPYRGVKGCVYEGGAMVPGLLEWPSRIPELPQGTPPWSNSGEGKRLATSRTSGILP